MRRLNQALQIGYPHDSHVNNATLTASFGMFPPVFKTYEKRGSLTEVFAQKKFSKGIFNLEICYEYTFNISNWISCQKAIMLVISYRSRALRSPAMLIITNKNLQLYCAGYMNI